MLVDFYRSIIEISPVLKSVSDNMLATLNLEEQGFVRFIFNMISEVCGKGIRFNKGELQASDAKTALKGLANAGRLLVKIVEDAGGSYRIMAEKVCMAAPGDRSTTGYIKNALGAVFDTTGTAACVSRTIETQSRAEKEMVESRVGSSFGRINLMIKIAAICGTTSFLALAADMGFKVPASIGRRITGTQKNQLALEGGKKSRRKSHKKTKRKQRKSRKKTGHRSRKTGRRSRKTGHRSRKAGSRSRKA
jgi:hypothetical protein